MMKMLGFETVHTTAYHPQMSGKSNGTTVAWKPSWGNTLPTTHYDGMTYSRF